jgi:hypothetical protein
LATGFFFSLVECHRQSDLVACLTSAQKDVETSCGPAAATRSNACSGLVPSIAESAAAAIAGERLIPPSQVTRVATPPRTKLTVVSIAAWIMADVFPAPSIKGNRQ